MDADGGAPPRLVELPSAALALIASHLDGDDKRSLAQTCKAWVDVVRPTWSTLLLDYTLESGAPSADGGARPPQALAPRGIAAFAGLRCVVWAAGRDAAAARLADARWEDDASFEAGESPEAEGAAPPGGEPLPGAGPGGGGGSFEARMPPSLPRLLLQLSARLRELAARVPRVREEGLRLVVGGTPVDSAAALAALLDACGCGAGPSSPPLFTAIDVGACDLDGALGAAVRRATQPWCAHAPPGLALGRYPALERLRVVVKECDAAAEEQEAGLAAAVLAPLAPAAAPALRELHLGRPASEEPMRFPAAALALPALTRLVLNERVVLGGAFAELAHLTGLVSLSVAFAAFHLQEPAAAAAEPPQHPQDLAALAALPRLSALSVANWAVRERQDLAALRGLTELHLERFTGAAALVKPAGALPRLRGASFCRAPAVQDQRYREDSVWARWALRRLARGARLPRVRVLHLGTLGSAPAEVRRAADLPRAAAVVDDHAAPALARLPRLRYLQLSCVLNIRDDTPEGRALDARCEAGLKLDRLLVAAGCAGAWRADDAGSGASSAGAPRWRRTLEFSVDRYTEVLVAEFHYERVGGGAGGGGGDSGESDSDDSTEGSELGSDADEGAGAPI